MNHHSHRRTIWERIQIPLLLSCCLILSGCDLFSRGDPDRKTFNIPIANRPVDLELALTIAERQQGLQRRLQLDENGGMAFLFEVPQKASFWMKNTNIPLDIGFFTGDGVLREIHQMYPNVEVPIGSFRDDIVIAIEMNQGWFQKNGIKPGDLIDLNRLFQAIKASGEDPGEYPFLTSRSLR